MSQQRVSHIDASVLPDELKNWYEIEELVFDYKIENKERLVSILPSLDPLYRESLAQLIVSVYKMFPYRSNEFVDLYRTLDLPIDLINCRTFKNLLLPQDQHVEVPEYETISDFSQNQVVQALIDDDLNIFQSLAPSSNILDFTIDYNGERLTCLSASAFFSSVRIFRYILDCNVSLAQDPDVSKYSVRGGNLEILQIILDSGIDISQHFADAIEYHRYAVANLILDRYPIDLEEVWLNDHSFSTLGIYWYYSTVDYDFSVALCGACFIGNGPLMIYCLHRGADIDSEENDNTVLTRAIEHNFYEMSKYLVENGADIEIPDDDYECPLTYAVRSRNMRFVQLLIDHEVNLNREGECLRNAINENPDIKQFLMQHGYNEH